MSWKHKYIRDDALIYVNHVFRFIQNLHIAKITLNM